MTPITCKILKGKNSTITIRKIKKNGGGGDASNFTTNFSFAETETAMPM
jgi:hypothetical protein